MENKNKILIGLQLLVIIILGYLIIKSNQSIQLVESLKPDPDPITNHNLYIEKDDAGIWRVMDNNGFNMGDLVVHRKDTINWHFNNSDAEMGFKFQDLNRYFRFERGGPFQDTPDSVARRFPGSKMNLREIFRYSRSQFVEMNNTITLIVKDKAPYHTLYYPIYIAEDDTLVVRNSPAMLDIQESH